MCNKLFMSSKVKIKRTKRKPNDQIHELENTQISIWVFFSWNKTKKNHPEETTKKIWSLALMGQMMIVDAVNANKPTHKCHVIILPKKRKVWKYVLIECYYSSIYIYMYLDRSSVIFQNKHLYTHMIHTTERTIEKKNITDTHRNEHFRSSFTYVYQLDVMQTCTLYNSEKGQFDLILQPNFFLD